MKKNLKPKRALATMTEPQTRHGAVYETAVPDTLDLAERAVLGLHGLAGVLSPEANYEFWWSVNYDVQPACMARDARSFAACGPKLLDAFVMMRVMTGSEDFFEQEEGLAKLLVSSIADDGLWYCKVGAERPWDTVGPEDYANVYGQSRMMLAMMSLSQSDGDAAWLRRIGKMASGMTRIAIDKGDYAYYPANMGNDKIKMGEGYCHPRSGWYNTEEATTETEGTEGSMFMYHCGPIRALSRWYQMSGDEKAIQSAKKLVRYVTRAGFWGSEYGWPKTVDGKSSHAIRACKIVGGDRAHFEGHFHGHAAMLFALIEYANTVNDKHLKEFVRSGYEYARNFGIARLGLFGETCTISDMLAVAVKLSDGGVGDYWDDVDGYIRNQMIEQQLIDADLLRKVSAASPPRASTVPAQFESNENVIERTIGVFADDGDLGQIPGTLSIQCCTANGTQGLYYAWEGIIREKKNDHVQVNLLLNRASPWMDIESYLPYQGKVVLRNKTARTLSLRIPNWVNRSKVKCAVNGAPRDFSRVGNYAILDGLKQNDQISFTFPIEEEKVTYTVLTRQQWTSDPREAKNPPGASVQYVCHFKGNTLVDFSPRPSDDRWYPIYRRDRYKQSRAPLKKVTRYVSPTALRW